MRISAIFIDDGVVTEHHIDLSNFSHLSFYCDDGKILSITINPNHKNEVQVSGTFCSLTIKPLAINGVVIAADEEFYEVKL